MRELFEIWKGHKIYFNWRTGQFETDRGFSSYVQSHTRRDAVNGF